MWGVVLLNLPLYCAIVLIYLSVQGDKPDALPHPALMSAGAAAAIAAGLASLGIDRVLLSDRRLAVRLQAPVSPEALIADPRTGHFDAKLLDSVKTLSDAELRVYAIASRRLAHMFVRWGLAEIPALLGMVMAITTADPRVFLVFAAGSLVLMVLGRPSLPALIDRLQRFEASRR